RNGFECEIKSSRRGSDNGQCAIARTANFSAALRASGRKRRTNARDKRCRIPCAQKNQRDTELQTQSKCPDAKSPPVQSTNHANRRCARRRGDPKSNPPLPNRS